MAWVATHDPGSLLLNDKTVSYAVEKVYTFVVYLYCLFNKLSWMMNVLNMLY